MQVGVAHVESGGDGARVIEVIGPAYVVAVEDLGEGVLAEEGIGTAIRYGVADADGNGVEIEADITLVRFLFLGVGRDGRQSENDDSCKVPKLHYGSCP